MGMRNFALGSEEQSGLILQNIKYSHSAVPHIRILYKKSGIGNHTLRKALRFIGRSDIRSGAPELRNNQ